MNTKPMKYIIRKYIYAKTALEAIKKDKVCPVHDCWVDPDWMKVADDKSEFGYDCPKIKKIGDK